MQSIVSGLCAAAFVASFGHGGPLPWVSALAECARRQPSASMFETGRVTHSYDCGLPGGVPLMVRRDARSDWRWGGLGPWRPGHLARIESLQALSVVTSADTIESWYAVKDGPIDGSVVRWRFGLAGSELDVFSRSWVRANPYGGALPSDVIREVATNQ